MSHSVPSSLVDAVRSIAQPLTGAATDHNPLLTPVLSWLRQGDHQHDASGFFSIFCRHKWTPHAKTQHEVGTSTYRFSLRKRKNAVYSFNDQSLS